MSLNAIILGASPTGLAVLRALGSHSVSCLVADTDRSRHCFQSKYASPPAIVASSPDEVVAQALTHVEQSRETSVFIPTSDAMVLALADHAHKMPANARTYRSIESGLAKRITDKQGFYELCQRAGIAMPQTLFPSSRRELLAIGNDFLFPLLLKPIYGHLWRERLNGRKLIVANSKKELEQHADKWGEDCTGLMVQELIPGEERNIFVGAIYRGRERNRDYCFVAEKTRQYPPDFGSASLATAHFRSDIAALSWQFVEATDFQGICGTEFKLDPRDNQFKMIEVNPRPTLWFHLAKAAGVDLLYGAFCDLAGRPLPPAQPQRDGTRWCFFEKDILTWGHHLRHRDVSPLSLLSTFSPRNHGAAGCLSDPMPMLSSPLYYAKQLYRRVLRR